MAQLDRFLNLLVTNNGTALVMSEGEVATVTIKDSPRPVMKQPLTSAQILTLLREIAPANQSHSLDAAGGVRFEYSCADGTFEVSRQQHAHESSAFNVVKCPPSPQTPAKRMDRTDRLPLRKWERKPLLVRQWLNMLRHVAKPRALKLTSRQR